jgi:hypothetical protein
VGETIQLRSGAMGGLMDGVVTEIGIIYVRLDTADGPMSLPNSQVLAAAVSRRSEPGGTPSRPGAINGHRSASATPADAPTAAPTDGQQAGPADLGLAAPAHVPSAPDRQPPQEPKSADG